MWWWWWRYQRWEMRAPFLCLYLVTHSPATMCADVDSCKFRSHELFLHDTLDLSSSSSLSLSFIPLLISQLRCCASGDAIWVLITWCLCSAEQVLCSGSPHPRRRACQESESQPEVRRQVGHLVVHPPACLEHLEHFQVPVHCLFRIPGPICIHIIDPEHLTGTENWWDINAMHWFPHQFNAMRNATMLISWSLEELLERSMRSWASEK